jgi:hypothetical protein
VDSARAFFLKKFLTIGAGYDIILMSRGKVKSGVQDDEVQTLSLTSENSP